MNIRKVKSEMEMVTGVMTNDIEYLLYLLLHKSEDKEEPIIQQEVEEDELKQESVEEWFKQL